MKIIMSMDTHRNKKWQNQDDLIVYNQNEIFARKQRFHQEKVVNELSAIVCDGISAYQNAKESSKIAIDRIYQRKNELNCGLMDWKQVAQEGVLSIKGGTTLLAIYIKNNQLAFMNIGDSPLYLIRNQQITRLSIPHTLGYAKRIREEAYTIQDDHTLIYYLGNSMMKLDNINIKSLELQNNDILVLASDGISEGLSEKMMMHLAIDKGARELVKRARKNTRDNCSALVLKIRE